MAVYKLLTTITLCVLSASFTVAQTCVDLCVPPKTTITSFVTAPVPTSASCGPPLPDITTTCKDNVVTVSRTATVIFDCSPLPSTTVPYTRCPTATTAWLTTAAPCPPVTAGTVTDCPKAKGTVTAITRYTLPGLCFPTKKTVTITAPPTGTDTLPVCTTTSTVVPVPLAPYWGQCGGKLWTGPTVCAKGKCEVANEYFSQCL